MNDESPFQPILPRVSMRWYFVIAAAVAGVVAWVLASSYQQTLSAILLLLCLAASSFLVLSSLLFLVAYTIGSVEKILFKSEEQTHSPFAHETMPPQIIPPSSSE